MSNMTTQNQQGTQMALPALFTQLFGKPDGESDLTAGIGAGGFPVIHFKGKVWSLSRSGERESFLDENGDAKQSIEVVIVKAAPNLAKSWYAKKFTDGEDAGAPDCYSNNGVAPAPDSKSAQCKTCAACKHNQFGSAVSTDGTSAKGKACQDVKRLAVVPVGTVTDPMLLRVPPASLKNLREFATALAKRNVPYQAVKVRIGFDTEAASPKLTFRPTGAITEQDAYQIAELMKDEIIMQITGEAAGAVAAPDEFEEGLPAGDDSADKAAQLEAERAEAAEKEAKARAAAEKKAAAERKSAEKAAADKAEAEKANAEATPQVKETVVAETAADLDDFLSRIGIG